MEILPPSIASQPSQAGWPGRVRSAVLPPHHHQPQDRVRWRFGMFFTLYAGLRGYPHDEPENRRLGPTTTRNLPLLPHERKLRSASAPKRDSGDLGICLEVFQRLSYKLPLRPGSLATSGLQLFLLPLYEHG